MDTSTIIKADLKVLLAKIKPSRALLKRMLQEAKINGVDTIIGLECIRVIERLYQLEEAQIEEASYGALKTEYDDTTPCPLGKSKGYYGKPLKEVPDDFLRWVMRQDWCEEKYPQLADYIRKAVLNKEEQADLIEKEKDDEEEEF